MTILAVAVKHLVALGMAGDDLAAAIAEMQAADDVRSVGARRQQRYRDRRNEASQSVTSDASVTPPSLDKESFPQTPFKEINPIPRERATPARGSRLPDGWRPTTCTADTKAGKVIQQRGQEWARDTLESFTNHWRGKAGRDACKVDWQATWANWVTEQDRRDGRNGQRVNGQSSSGLGRTVDAVQLALRRATGDTG